MYLLSAPARVPLRFKRQTQNAQDNLHAGAFGDTLLPRHYFKRADLSVPPPLERETRLSFAIPLRRTAAIHLSHTHTHTHAKAWSELKDFSRSDCSVCVVTLSDESLSVVWNPANPALHQRHYCISLHPFWCSTCTSAFFLFLSP